MDDISEITKLIGKFFPVIIFLIWVLISVFANARRRGPTGRPIPPPERPTYGEHQEQPSRDESGSSQISDDLRRTLETIFGESNPVETKVPEPEPEPMERESETNEMQTSKESAILEEQAAIQRAFSEVEQKVRQIPVAPTIQLYETEDESGEFIISQEELRKGFIWSEILAPPVAMR
jgi:hypothetical protein